jgi:surface protein
MKPYQLFLILLLPLTPAIATLYEDAEDKTTNAWRVTDNHPSGAVISNVFDKKRDSNVIEFMGKGWSNAYTIGHKRDVKGWKNHIEKHLSLTMQFSKKYQIYIYLETKNGKRILTYTPNHTNQGRDGEYIQIGLGSKTVGSNWVEIKRNLEKDLKKYAPSNQIKYVNGIKFRGSGRVDNIELTRDNRYRTDKSPISRYKSVDSQKSTHKEIDDKERREHKNKRENLNHKKESHLKEKSPLKSTHRSKKIDQMLHSKDAFITKWEILKQRDGRVILPIFTDENFKYNFHIDWGDGTQDWYVKSKIIHKYEKEGVYRVSIVGEYPKIVSICFHRVSRYRATYHKLLSVEQWGTQKWKSMSHAFWFCQDLNQIRDRNAPDLSEVKSMNSMFKYAKIFNQPLNHWDTSHVHDISRIFSGAESFNQNLESWNTSSVESMRDIFSDSAIETLPSWATPKK